MLHVEAPLPAVGHEPLIAGDGQSGLGRAGETGAAGGGVGIQCELGHHQKAAAHLLQIQVHLFVFILKDPQIADLVRQLVGGDLRIVGAYAQQHQKTGAYLTVDLFIDDNRGVFDSCNNSTHGSNSLFNTRKGMLRNGPCPQIGQIRVFCILSRAVLCGSGENPFPMPRKISPQAG